MTSDLTNLTELIRRAVENENPKRRFERDLVRRFHEMFNEMLMLGGWQPVEEHVNLVRESVEARSIQPGLRLLSMFPPACGIIVD